MHFLLLLSLHACMQPQRTFRHNCRLPLRRDVVVISLPADSVAPLQAQDMQLNRRFEQLPALPPLTPSLVAMNYNTRLPFFFVYYWEAPCPAWDHVA